MRDDDRLCAALLPYLVADALCCGEDADADAFLFAAYCEGCASLRGSARSNRRRSEAVTAELERLGPGGVDFDEVEADPRVARASATWLALADAATATDAYLAERTREDARAAGLAALGIETRRAATDATGVPRTTTEEARAQCPLRGSAGNGRSSSHH